MIFVTVGTQKFNFDRLLKIIDDLILKKIINEPVFAQIGYSSYCPKNYKFTNFLSSEEFESIINKSSLVICHAGIGTIIKCLNFNKKIIVMPRKVFYKEHVDNHQCEIAQKYYELGYILKVDSENELINAMDKIEKFNSCYKKNNNKKNEIFIDYIINYINNN